MGPVNFVAATPSDAEAIAQLVNAAYRPEAGAAGWTHEAEFVAGSRISASQVAAILTRPDAVILLGLEDQEIVACVLIERRGSASSIGLLAVTPRHQGKGIGTRLLDHAERYARTTLGSEQFTICVLTARTELMDFYGRRGYQRTGIVADYPRLAGVGMPISPDLKTEALTKLAGHPAEPDRSQDAGEWVGDRPVPAAVVAAEVAPRTKPSSYPEPFVSRMAGRTKRTLGEVFGLANFGVNLTTLEPGSISSLRHAHSKQDEFIYILAGHPVLVTDQGEAQLSPGMCAGFKAGASSAHHLINRSEEDVVVLEVGDRSPGDSAVYPDDDLQALFVNGQWEFTHKGGSAYGMISSP
ncbi:GNAT family N-acetyltransferase [Vulcanococcus limneticus]|uniref:GNAT family N-acetyltransferase n=1 Tax=Vulcanococcus limneticus TaxID=2170428 RepID=UPI00398BED56